MREKHEREPAMSERILHGGDGTPHGRKVRIVLAEKGLDYRRDTTPAQEKPEAALARLNPALRVPILEDRGRALFESDLIVAYLLATYPDPAPDAPAPPLAPTLHRPEHPWEDALVLCTCNNALEAGVNLRQLGRSGVRAEQSAYLQRHQRRIASCLDWLEERAAPEGFLPGWFSLQDLSLVCALDFLERWELATWRGRPRLERLHERLSGRPSVVATRQT